MPTKAINTRSPSASVPPSGAATEGWRGDAYRDFRVFRTARFASFFSVQLTSVAIGWHLYELTSSALALGFVGLAAFVPEFILAPFSGHVADRFDRKRVLSLCYAVQAISATLFLLAITLTPRATWQLYALLIAAGTGNAFVLPASQALLPHLVPAERFQPAVASVMIRWQLATVVGPILSGALYTYFAGARAALAVAAACSTLASVCAWLVRTRTPTSHDPISFERLTAGVRFLRGHKAVLGTMMLDFLVVGFGGATILLPAMARDRLAVGPIGLGMMRAAPAIGAAACAMALQRWPLQRHAGRKLLFSTVAFGISTMAFGASTSFVVSLLALVATGASDMVSVVVRQTIVQSQAPSEIRGRVTAVGAIFIGASNNLGAFESGVLASWLGLAPSIIAGGAGACVVVVILALALPELARFEFQKKQS